MSNVELAKPQLARSRSPDLPSSTQLPSDAMSDLQQFFTGDDGNSLVLPLSHDAPIQQNLRPLPNLTRRASVSSFATTFSRSSVSTVMPLYGVLDLSLTDVCNHIDGHSSLRSAKIISTECYAIKAGAVMHRFVVLELRRDGRKDVWLRLDRRRGNKVSIFQFLAASGITQANDRAMLSADKDSLVEDASRENRQVFEVPPVLGEFTRLLRIIKEEIVMYRIWPENCWFFCSLIQQHLEGTETGWFVIGSLKYANLANGIRTRIYERVLAGRPPTHQPRMSDIPTFTLPARTSLPPIPPSSISSPSTTQIASTLLMTAPSSSPSINTAIHFANPSAEVIETLERITENDLLEESTRAKVAQALGLAADMGEDDGNTTHDRKATCAQLALLLDNVCFSLPGFERLRHILQSEAVRLQRGISLKTPLGEQATLGTMLYNLGLIRGLDDRPKEACDADEEAILIRRERYRIRPSASRLDLAWSLFNYAMHLYACGRYEEACVADAEAVGLCRLLFERDQDEHRKDYAESLHNYGFHLAHVSRFEDARRNYEEAIVLYRQLYETSPEEHRDTFSRCLTDYSKVLDDLGMMSERRLVIESKTLRASTKPASSSNRIAPNNLGLGNEASTEILEVHEALKTEAEGDTGEDSSVGSAAM